MGWLLPGQAGWETRARTDRPWGATGRCRQREHSRSCGWDLLQNAVFWISAAKRSDYGGADFVSQVLAGFPFLEGEGRASHYSLPARDAEQKQTRWSQHLLGWKRALKSLKSNQHLTVPGPPLSHIPWCHIHAPLKHPLGWGCHQHPGQPVLVPFCKEILLTPTLNLPWHNLRPLPRILSPVS